MGGGRFGQRLKLLFGKLTDSKRYLASHLMLRQRQCGESTELFARALTGITEDGVVYKSDKNPRELMLYMGRKSNEQTMLEIEFAMEAYMPFDYSLRVFWNHPFGIMEDDRCMQIGSIEIY